MSDSSASGYDAFQPDGDSSGYSPEKWYTRSTNTKGFDKSLKVVAVPPELIGAIEQIVQSGKTPLRTKADAFRDSLVHWVNMRNAQLRDPDFDGTVQVVTRLAEAERLRGLGQTARDLIKTRGDHLAEERDPAIVRVIVEQMRADLPTMPSDYYRDEIQRLINQYDR